MPNIKILFEIARYENGGIPGCVTAQAWEAVSTAICNTFKIINEKKVIKNIQERYTMQSADQFAKTLL